MENYKAICDKVINKSYYRSAAEKLKVTRKFNIFRSGESHDQLISPFQGLSKQQKTSSLSSLIDFDMNTTSTTISDQDDQEESDPSTKEDISSGDDDDDDHGFTEKSWNNQDDDQKEKRRENSNHEEQVLLQNRLIHIDRPALNQEEFHKLYGLEEGHTSRNHKSYTNGIASVGRSIRRNIRNWQEITCMNFLRSWIPILFWLPNYQWKQDFPNDVAAGFTVAVMQVPQGLAYAILASVPPIIGIYTAFFPAMMYIIFGTSKHASMGTFAVVSILTSKPIIEHCHNDPMMNENKIAECAVGIMSTITFLTGGLMLCLGLLRLGALNALLTDPLVSGFTTGAGIHVLTSQIKYIFGINMPKHIGPGRIVFSYVDLIKVMDSVNYVTLGMSVVSILILLSFDLIFKAKIALKCKFPVPIQFMVVIIGTLISYCFDFKNNFNVKVIGEVPKGLPELSFPNFEDTLDLFPDVITITIIGFVVSLSISRIVATKHGYSVDPNQELIAMGASNIFGTFFQSLPMTASMSRTMVQVSAGGRTLMASVVSIFMLLWVLLFAGPLFRDLPNCILAALIMVSLRGILMQFKDVKIYAKRSNSEIFVWLSTFLGTVFVDIDYGLIIGLGVTFIFLLWWGYYPKVELLSPTDHEDLFTNKSEDLCAEDENVAILKISGNLNLANAPLLEGLVLDALAKEYGEYESDQPPMIVIDLSCVAHLDPSACQQIMLMHKSFKKRNQDLSYAGIRGPVWLRMNDIKVFKTISKDRCYPTLQDALAYQNNLTEMDEKNREMKKKSYRSSSNFV